jgi:hypothetical protein
VSERESSPREQDAGPRRRREALSSDPAGSTDRRVPAAGGPLGHRPDLVLWLVLATTALGILLGYLSKTPCTGPTFDQFGISPNLGLHKYDKLCYSDVQQLWIGRGVPEHTFP